MAKIGFVDRGSQCEACGKQVEPKYGLNVVVHARKKRYLQFWCVECVAKSTPGSIHVQQVGELDKCGKLIQVGR
jgi:hypothetical protein